MRMSYLIEHRREKTSLLNLNGIDNGAIVFIRIEVSTEKEERQKRHKKKTGAKIDNVKEFRTNERWLQENNEHVEKSSKQCMLACKNNEHWSKMKSE